MRLSSFKPTKTPLQLAILGLLCLTGCAVGPNYQQPDLHGSVPTQFNQIEGSNLATAPAINDRWWQTWNDAAITQLVELALARNLDLASADASIKQARAQLTMIDSSYQPQINADGRIGRDQFSKNSENFANIPFPNPKIGFTDYRVGLDASWELDLFGATARSVEAGKARVASIELQRQDLSLRIAAEVVRNVIDYRTYQARVKNAEAMLADSKNLLEIATIQQKAGLLSNSDLMDAQVAVHNTEAMISPLKSAATSTLLSLSVLVNQPQEQVSSILSSAKSDSIDATTINSIGVPSDLLLRRPDLRSAERQLAAATADIGVAVAAQYPQINLVGNLGLDTITPGKLTDLASRYWSLGPQLSIPLLNGGRLSAQVSSKEAARDAAIANYRQAVLVAFADTESALIRYQREQQRLGQIRAAYSAQQQQFGYAEKRYQLGDTNYANVLQARLQLAQLHDTELTSQQALGENLTALYKALGGGVVGAPESSSIRLK